MVSEAKHVGELKSTMYATSPFAVEANAIIVYAWNEIYEGGWLVPYNTEINPSEMED